MFRRPGLLQRDDCSSFVCNVERSLCVATQCDDAALSLGETDVDCGGSCGATCALGRSCAQASDWAMYPAASTRTGAALPARTIEGFTQPASQLVFDPSFE